MTRAVDDSEKLGFCLVEFAYNIPPEFTRLTDSLSDEDFGGLHLSMPAMEVDLPANTGTFEEQKLAVTLPIEFPDGTPLQFAIDIASGDAFFPKTTVLVTEIIRGTTGAITSSRYKHFRGQVKRAIRNKEGKSRKIVVESLARKSLLSFASGRIATNSCQHTLFDNGCGLGIDFEMMTMLAINGAVVTMTVGAPRLTNHYLRGYMEFKGVRIGIREWDFMTPARYVLVRRPPTAWNGQAIKVVMGCNKSPERCRELGNEQFITSMGYSMPSYHPVFEDS